MRRTLACQVHSYDLPDPIAMAVALDSAVATSTLRRFVAVETGGEWCRGQTVVDHADITGVGENEANVEVVLEASRERFLELLYAAVGEWAASMSSPNRPSPDRAELWRTPSPRSSSNFPSTKLGE